MNKIKHFIRKHHICTNACWRSLGLILLTVTWTFGQGPGIGNLTYSDEELFSPIWIYEDPTHLGSNVGMMINGYFVTTFHPDSGKPPGGILVFDVSDPRSPVEMTRIYNEQTSTFREEHAFGHWEDYLAFQDINGIQIWDFSDPTNPFQVSRLVINGYFDDDYGSSWQVFWQAPYIYIANGSAGYDIVDASDVSNPLYVKHIDIGMQVGPIFAIGNMLYTMAHDTGRGLAISDISDPENPFLINSQREGLQNIYAASINGKRIISSARGNSTNSEFTVHDVSDPTNFMLEMVFDIENDGEQLYNNSQDHFIFQGCQDEIVKIDISNPAKYLIEGRGGLNVDNSDHGQITPIGNLIFVGNDHGSGSGFIVHQKEPDTKGPEVNMIVPEPGSTNQSILSRVGITMTDNVDLRSVTKETFIVRPLGGAPLDGKYSHQTAIVNFSPNQALEENMTYEILIPKDGISDWMSNPTEFDIVSYFSTGSEFANSVPSTPLRFYGVGFNDQVELHWDTSPNATEYVIERSDPTQDEFQVIATASSNSWVDTDVEEGQSYRYRIYSLNDEGNSPSTLPREVMAFTPAYPPGMIENLVGLGSTDHVKLTWDAGTDAEAYVIQRSVGLTEEFGLPDTVSVLNYEDFDVMGNETYYYKIWSFNSTGSSNARIIMVPSGEFDYLSDLDWVQIENGWGDAEPDRSNGEEEPDDGTTLQINDVIYSKGIGAHAPSEIELSLSGNYQYFLSDVGVDEETGSSGSVIFKVYVDGSLKYSSDKLTGADDPQGISINVEHAEKLSLIITHADDGTGKDHGDWANARLIQAGDKSVLSTQPPAVWIYPNPADSYVQVKPEIRNQLTGIRIYQVSGQNRMEFRKPEIGNTIDISSLSPGFYVIYLEGETISKQVKLFVEK